MKNSSLLKQFKYSIPASALSLAVMKENHIAAEHLSLMEIAIDFENGVLKLEGDWQFMIASNKHNKTSWFGHHRQRVKIETAIYPALAIDLNDPESDCFVFPMEGNIKDGDHPSSCSGLLVIDNIRENNGLIGNHWSITFYLYETQFDDCEIKFKLPLYQTLPNKNNN